MIKINKNVTGKEKNKSINQLKPIKSKSKINLTKSILIQNKPEPTTLKTTKTFYEPKRKINRKIAIHNSISSRQEIKLKNSPVGMMRNNKNKQNLKLNKNNCNKIIISNNTFSTRGLNSLSKEKEKKFKKYNSNFNKKNISKINDIFKKNILKQTIIIDNEGNNNLNLNIQLARQKNYKTILDNKKFENFNDKIEICNSTVLSENNETNSLFETSCNYNKNILNRIDKEKDSNLIIANKKEEEKRIKEYDKIFNLLNTNIEQFKKMFVNKQNNNINKIKAEKGKDNKKIIIKKKKKYKNSTIPTGRNSNRKHKISEDKKKNCDLNLKKNLSEENMKYNKVNSNNKMLYIDINNEKNVINNINEYYNINQNNKEIKNNNYSFLESSIDNDFYQTLINQNFLNNISYISFDVNNNSSNKENFEINNMDKINDLVGDNISEIMKEKFDINSNKKKENNSKNELINNINLLIKKKNIEKLNIKTDSQNNYQNYIKYLDKKNCTIF